MCYQRFPFIVSVQKILLLGTKYRIERLATSAHKLLSAGLQSQYLPSFRRKSSVSQLLAKHLAQKQRLLFGTPRPDSPAKRDKCKQLDSQKPFKEGC